MRGGSLAASMSSYLIGRLEQDPAVSIHFNAEVVELGGGDRLEGVTIRDNAAAQDRRLDARAVLLWWVQRPTPAGWPDA